VNKKILLAFTSFLIVAMMATPLALALSWEPKNNSKFQSFDVTATLLGGTNQEQRFVPSEDAPNIVFISADEVMENYQITIDGTRTYLQDTHFTYNGHLTWTLYAPELPLQAPPYLTPCRMLTLDVKYSYTFLPASGIEGTINMHAMARGETITDLLGPGDMLITSMQGTGDLKNVNIKATTAGGGVAHMGIVSGWPDTPIPS